MQVTNGAQLLLANNASIGDGGTGSLTVSGGSQVATSYGTTGAIIALVIGNQAGSFGTVSVTDPGTVFLALRPSIILVGNAGAGVFSATNGATIHTDHVIVAGDTSVRTSLAVNGSGTLWTNDDNMDIGGIPGSLQTVETLATVENAGQLRVAPNPGSHLYISPTGTMVLDSTGQVAVGSGAFGAPGTVRIGAGGLVRGQGTVQASVLVGSGGIFEPGGVGVGTFTIQGNYDQTDAGVGGGRSGFRGRRGRNGRDGLRSALRDGLRNARRYASGRPA